MPAEEAVWASVPYNYAARTRRDGGQRIAEDIAQRLRFPIEPEPYVAQLAAALGHDAYERLGAMSHPTLVVHGAEDRMVHPDNARLLAERIPAAQLQLWEQTAHLLFTDEPGVGRVLLTPPPVVHRVVRRAPSTPTSAAVERSPCSQAAAICFTSWPASDSLFASK